MFVEATANPAVAEAWLAGVSVSSVKRIADETAGGRRTSSSPSGPLTYEPRAMLWVGKRSVTQGGAARFPSPDSMLLLGSGLAALLMRRRRS